MQRKTGNRLTFWVFLGGGIAAAAADLASKAWVFAVFEREKRYAVIDGFLDLYPTLNRGGVFGIGQGWSWVFVVITVFMLGVLVWLYLRVGREGVVSSAALGLLLGGALGNLWDRVFCGGVRDFILVHLGRRWYWFPFNLADAFLVVGGVLLFLIAWRLAPPEEKKAASTG